MWTPPRRACVPAAILDPPPLRPAWVPRKNLGRAPDPHGYPRPCGPVVGWLVGGLVHCAWGGLIRDVLAAPHPFRHVVGGWVVWFILHCVLIRNVLAPPAPVGLWLVGGLFGSFHVWFVDSASSGSLRRLLCGLRGPMGDPYSMGWGMPRSLWLPRTHTVWVGGVPDTCGPPDPYHMVWAERARSPRRPRTHTVWVGKGGARMTVSYHRFV